MESKTELRTKAKALRKTLDIEAISTGLANLVRRNDIYKNSNNVLLFYPTKYEVDLRALLEDNKKFYLPKVVGKDLVICPYKNGDKLEKSNIGIFEPVTVPVDKSVLDLVIVPALMVDNKGYRLGYGGGFYDRFLQDFEGNTLCAIPKELITNELPHDEFDIKVKQLIVG